MALVKNVSIEGLRACDVLAFTWMEGGFYAFVTFSLVKEDYILVSLKAVDTIGNYSK